MTYREDELPPAPVDSQYDGMIERWWTVGSGLWLGKIGH